MTFITCQRISPTTSLHVLFRTMSDHNLMVMNTNIKTLCPHVEQVEIARAFVDKQKKKKGKFRLVFDDVASFNYEYEALTVLLHFKD